MDAREKLRRYLEQRREMGESELVLDTMTVEDALRIVGGKSTVLKSEPSSPVDSARATPARNVSGGRTDDLPTTADWRAALRETGAAPDQSSRATHPPKIVQQATPPAPSPPATRQAPPEPRTPKTPAS